VDDAPRLGRLSLAKCRQLLGDDTNTDDEICCHEAALHGFAELVCDAYAVSSESHGDRFDRLRAVAPGEDWEAVEERAALREYEGGQSRDKAERAAVYEVLGYAEEARK
jgi:hypothetical protein